MTVDLIPQDELTLELLARVLAKMYRHSRNGDDDTPDNPQQLSYEPAVPDCDEHRESQDISEQRLLHV